MAGGEDLIVRAVERLAEDEALRGNLGDRGFAALLDWGVAALQSYAARARSEAGRSRRVEAVREAIRGAVRAAEDALRGDDLACLVPADAPGREEAVRQLTALRLGDEADENAVRLAAALQAALKPAGSPPCRRGGRRRA